MIRLDYKRGLQILKSHLPDDVMDEFEIYEARMLENLHHKQLFGDPPTTQANRNAIIYDLNVLAHRYGDMSYNEMCYNPQVSRVSPVSTPSSTVTGQAVADTNMQHEESSRTNTIRPHVETELVRSIVPTAYCRTMDVDNFPLVTITFNNTCSGWDDLSLTVSAFIENYSDLAARTIDLAKDEQKSVSLLPVLQPEAVSKLNEIQQATLHVKVKWTSSKMRISPFHETHSIRLHARNTALLALEKPDREIKDLTEYLAAWVTPHHPELEKLQRKAVKYLPSGFPGYGAANSLSESILLVREQARAIFFVLQHDVNLAYVDSALRMDVESRQKTQRVRLPAEILAIGGSANCLDGTVLFASLLELIGIQPVIVLVPGHAFVGWRICKDVDRYEFAETTMISTGDFDAAQRYAQELFDDAQFYRYFGRTLFDPFGFACLIDVAACRRKDIYPLE